MSKSGRRSWKEGLERLPGLVALAESLDFVVIVEQLKPFSFNLARVYFLPGVFLVCLALEKC